MEGGTDAAAPAQGVLDPGVPPPFGPRSVVRHVVAHPVTSLLVQRALVMDVAHPAVAAGVEHHSRFRAQPLRRAWATVDVALRLTFGDAAVARGAVRQIYGVHDRVHGPVPGHGSYSAHDAALLTWVWATLVDTAETGFTRWVRPLAPDEARTFYTEMVALGRFLGIPAELLPPTRADFAAYLDAMLDGPVLGSDEACARMARQVLWFRHWSVPPAAVRVERVLALRTLDPRLVDRLGLTPGRADAALGRRLETVLGALCRRLPRAPVGAHGCYVALRRPTVGLARRLTPGAGAGERGSCTSVEVPLGGT